MIAVARPTPHFRLVERLMHMLARLVRFVARRDTHFRRKLMNKSQWYAGVVMTVFFALGFARTADADVGIGIRGGSFGYGLDFDIGLVQKLNLRLGYNGFDYNYTVDDTGVKYDGKIKISSFSALFDWHAFDGGFRVSLGAVASGPKVDVVGTPTGGTYQIGNGTYTASQVGSISGQIKIGNSVAPYVGLGWGNVLSEKHRVAFLFDIGAIYGGTPEVGLTVTCGSAASAQVCSQLQTDAQREIQDLRDNVSTVSWYPVVSIGIGIRF